MSVTVEWYAGGRGEETPRRLLDGSRVVEVAEILDRWAAPSGRGFRVRGSDGQVYELREDGSRGWRVDRV